jgi:hypothetical protein
LQVFFILIKKFKGVISGKPERFAIIYSTGNIITILGTGFLIGPMR